MARAYWKLWFIQKNKLVQRDQREILVSFSKQVRARLESGGTGLSDLAQVDLSISRISDVIAGLDEAERAATAELVRVIGADDGTATPIRPELDPPPALLPAPGESELKAAASELGMESVAVYPAADALSLHTRFATRAVEIGQGGRAGLKFGDLFLQL